MGEVHRIGQVGNLVLVPQDLNQRLGGHPFQRKKQLLMEAGIPLDAVLAQAGEWGTNAIEQRTKELARLAYNEIWNF
jgi:hypothetical protein